MNIEQKFKQLFADMRADLRDYQQLEESLRQQHQAALAHDVQALGSVNEHIVALTEQLQARQQLRVRLVISLLGGRHVSMASAFALLPQAARVVYERLWERLIDNASRCQTLNTRNGQILMLQQDSMERILFGEKNVYVAL